MPQEPPVSPRPARAGAVVLAGGRARRLDGADKPLLRTDRTTLLGATLRALLDRGVDPVDVVVVGPPSLAGRPEAAGIRVVREEPPFGGPVAGLAAGVAALDGPRAPDAVFTLACDMPCLAPGLSALAATADARPDHDAWIGLSPSPDGTPRREPLLALHRLGPLRAALAALPTRDLAVRTLLARLDVEPVPVPAGAATDVDTWEDARRLDVRAPGPTEADA